MHKFFIVGCPRSGTTMLQQALNRHPQIAIPAETKFFFFLLGRSLRWQAEQVQRINEDLRINLPVLVQRISTVTAARQLYEAMAESYLARLDRCGVTHFGEKSPEHLRRLADIRRVVPHGRIILLYRDGRDVALSLSRVPWMHPDVYVNFAVWLWYHRLQRQAVSRGWPNLLCVRYEELVTEPERTLRTVLDFLDLPYVPEVAVGSGNTEGVPEREYPWKARSFERISSSRVGLWRRELSIDQIRILERWGGPALRSLGYELDTDGASSLPLLFLPRLYGRICLWRTRKMLEWWLKPPPWRPSPKEKVETAAQGCLQAHDF